MATDERQAAAARIADLIALLREHPTGNTNAIVEECDALARAVKAFHMEGIRFRIFNVDRLIAKSSADLPAGVATVLEEVRRHLEAAGFHTRSHQAPT
jgi:hypothetical protein